MARTATTPCTPAIPTARPTGTATSTRAAGTNNFGYITRVSGVTISNDGVANDGHINPATGQSDENDNVGADFQRLYGGSGNDVLTGGNNADGLYGNAGDDLLIGNGGDDDLGGGDGNDKLIGGRGADMLSGGAGTYDEANFGDEPSGVGVGVTMDNAANDGLEQRKRQRVV